MNKQERKLWEAEQEKRRQNKQELSDVGRIMFDRLVEQCAEYDVSKSNKIRSNAQIGRDIAAWLIRVQLIYDIFYIPWADICDAIHNKQDQLKEARNG